MRNFIALTLVALAGIFNLNAEVRDLNHLKQNFVLETRQIHIPGHPEAFNPSIVRWQNKLLMSFRTYHPETRSTDAIGLIWLDDDFNPLSEPQMLRREGEVSHEVSEAKDPRLIVLNDEVYILYSNLYPFEVPTSRMYIGKLEIDGQGEFVVSYPTALLYYDREIRSRKEKNWVPFVYDNKLLLAYSLQPHRLLLPTLSGSCLTVEGTIGTIDWSWGELRGGTPALLVDGSYLAFFHSDKAMATVQSGEKVMNHYFMGAYTFEAEYPFALTGISPHPIVARAFYEGPMYKTWKPLRVVFPGGYIVNDDAIWVAYGRQDHEVWVVKLDKNLLLQSLTPIQTVKPRQPN